jgi:N-acetylglucosaminylphosphatidylinositol deacetylase
MYFKTAVLTSFLFIALHQLICVSFSWYWGLPRSTSEAREFFSDTFLLVTAHPDDECMFFGPFVRRVVSGGGAVHLLCLSRGNSEGLGAVREAELERGASKLGLSSVTVADDSALEDGFEHEWPIAVIQSHVERQRSLLQTNRLVTFDRYGVSGHPNHIALHRALGKWECLTLRTVPVWIKFLGPFGWPLAVLLYKRDRVAFANRTESGSFIVPAMFEHASQLLWFRKLYISTSLYMNLNLLSAAKDGD